MELEEEVGWYANSPSPLKIFSLIFLWGGGGGGGRGGEGGRSLERAVDCQWKVRGDLNGR